MNIITIDGPSGCGKGTLARSLAHRLSLKYLDSGALYRMLAYVAYKNNWLQCSEQELVDHCRTVQLNFEYCEEQNNYQAICNNEIVTQLIRQPKISQIASKISTLPLLRKQLLAIQRNFAMGPGLVTDGRDMGTIVFPQAKLKIYLDASIEERAKRRYKELKQSKNNVTLSGICAELEQRDLRDKNRSVAPLVADSEAIVIDSSDLSISQVLDLALEQAVSQGIV